MKFKVGDFIEIFDPAGMRHIDVVITKEEFVASEEREEVGEGSVLFTKQVEPTNGYCFQWTLEELEIWDVKLAEDYTKQSVIKEETKEWLK